MRKQKKIFNYIKHLIGLALLQKQGNIRRSEELVSVEMQLPYFQRSPW